MADHDDVHAHRLDVAGGVDQRLPFADAAALPGEIDHVCREARRGKGKAGARARAVLEKRVDHDPPAEGGHLLDAARRDFLEGVGRAQDKADLVGRELIEAEQVLAPPPMSDVSAIPCSSSLRLAFTVPPGSHRFRPTRQDALSLGAPRAHSEGKTDEIRLNRQLTPPAVDQDGQANHAGPAEVAERVHRGADRATREQHVVHQKQRHPIDDDVQLVGRTMGRGPTSERSSR